MNVDDELDVAIGQWLERKETEPGLLPGEFAKTLPAALRSQFLSELEGIAELDRLTTGVAPRDLPVRYGDFRVLGELGRGAMGAVYAAEQVSTGRRVALKVLHPHVAAELHSASRFQREARTAASLDHPGIVAVLGFGEEQGSAWLAMELVEGRSLQRLLAARQDTRDVDHGRAVALLADANNLAEVMADAADALEHAHRHNVVHRDVKPANLMLGDDGHIKVFDFGLATARDGDQPALTRTGDFLGTPLYMAPEQAKGAENGTARSDVYGLGAVLYECLCGRPPVLPGPLATVIDSILNRDPPDPRSVRPGLPSDLARIALQCLERDPDRRYATAAALADDLRRFAGGRSVRARPVGVWQRSMQRARRRPLVHALVGAVALLAVVALCSTIYGQGKASEVAVLARDADLLRIPQLLGGSPERLTVFGGASLRFYRSIGLGDRLPEGSASRSPRAAEAVQLGERLVAEQPNDAAAVRALAMALLDVGDAPERTAAVLEQLLALPDCVPGDRVMAAVFAQQRGQHAESRRLLGDAEDVTQDLDQADVAFWLGFWRQNRQDYFGAIAAFDRALANPQLDEERRYFALLHRGWCQTCPEVSRLREAEEDLLQAAALRPAYGTARLLWAALRCLDPTDDLSRPVAAVTEVLGGAEPWVTVLTARVLLALAERSTWQAGPVHFGAEFSPIAALPIAPDRAAALAGLSLSLLDGVRKAAPGQFDASYHRVAALTMVGRHDEAIVSCDDLLAGAETSRAAAVVVQRARVQLAAGRTQKARADVDAALALDADSVAAWRLSAAIAAHVGDLPRELVALERAVYLLSAMPRETSVFPDGAALLPELQLRRAETLMALGRRSEAENVIQNGSLGGVLAGEQGDRVQWQRAALFARMRGVAIAAPSAVAALPADSPLRWLFASAAEQAPVDASNDRAVTVAGGAVLRNWLTGETAAQLPVTAALANLRMARGDVKAGDAVWQSREGKSGDSPAALLERMVRGGADTASGAGSGAGSGASSAGALPLSALLPHVRTIVAESGGADRLLQLADAELREDPDNSEARLLRGAVLFISGQAADASGFLADTLTEHPGDLRARYLLAIAALSQQDRALVQRALQRGPGLLDAATLEGARAALRTPTDTSGAALIRALE